MGLVNNPLLSNYYMYGTLSRKNKQVKCLPVVSPLMIDGQSNVTMLLLFRKTYLQFFYYACNNKIADIYYIKCYILVDTCARRDAVYF